MHVFDANGDIIQPTKLVHKNRPTVESRLQQIFDLMMDPHRTSGGFYLSSFDPTVTPPKATIMPSTSYRDERQLPRYSTYQEFFRKLCLPPRKAGLPIHGSPQWHLPET